MEVGCERESRDQGSFFSRVFTANENDQPKDFTDNEILRLNFTCFVSNSQSVNLAGEEARQDETS